MDFSPPAFYIHSIFLASVLEWSAVSFSRGSSRPREWAHVSHLSCTAGETSLPLSPRGLWLTLLHSSMTASGNSLSFSTWWLPAVTVVFFFPILYVCLSFSCLGALARSPGTAWIVVMLPGSGSQRTSSVSRRYDVVVGLAGWLVLVRTHHHIAVVAFCFWFHMRLVFVNFLMNVCRTIRCFFSLYWDDINFILLMWLIILIKEKLNPPFISELNSQWPRYSILFVCYWIWFANSLWFLLLP